MMKLYEIADDYNGLLTAIENGELQDDEAVADSIESIQAVFEDKAESIALIIKSLAAEADAIKAEVDTLTSRIRAKQNSAERLKRYLASNLLSVGKQKLETSKVKLSFRKSESVTITDEQALFAACKSGGFEKLCKTKLETSFDKREIAKVIKSGVELAGAEITTTNNLQIK